MPPERRRDITYISKRVKESIADGAIKFRVRGTLGGDKTHYTGATAANCAELTVVKVLLNSAISDPESGWASLDIKDFYLQSQMDRPEFLRLAWNQIPKKTQQDYGLAEFKTLDNKVLFRVDGGMYGAPQAGRLAQEQLIRTCLEPAGYIQDPNVPCLFTHLTNGIIFSLVVDDFGVRYKLALGFQSLVDALKASGYELKVNPTGSKYLGMNINFDRQANTITTDMGDYVKHHLLRLNHTAKTTPSTPSLYTPPHYGVNNASQLVDTSPDTSPRLDDAAVKTIQSVVGAFSYLAHVHDYTLLPTVNLIASQQKNPTAALQVKVDRMLDYIAANPSNQQVISASDMILYIQSDASYLSRPNAGSVAGGVHYFGNRNAPTHVNSPVHCGSHLIDVIVASAAEAEYASCFKQGQVGAYLRTIAAAVGFPQHEPTMIMVDNKCAKGLAHQTVKIKRAKSIDMRFHWIRDRVRQGQFTVHWRKGAHNLADYFTKPLPVHQHLAVIPLLVRAPLRDNPTTLLTRKRLQWSHAPYSAHGPTPLVA